ncbi:MAG: peptidylprolyl isomerase [Simkaniaceae bacterium]|nr:peptidylprolyl isomerase [Simkaniaceae bacterium]
MKYLLAMMLCVCSLFAKDKGANMSKKPIVVMETTQGVIEIELKPDVAPKACENMMKHAAKGYYDGIIFHRIISNFMIQGGDPTGTGRGGESIWGKPFEDECTTKEKFDRPGILAMANAGPKTNGSQFFITTTETPWLNGAHTIFGEVVKGYDVVEKLEKVKTGMHDKPVEDQKIIKVYVKK